MMREEMVVFKAADGKCYNGKVVYHDDWYEEWKSGNDPALVEVIFEENNIPPYMRKEDIPEVIDRLSEEFKEKTGLTWEEFCNRGCPNYEELRKERMEKIREKLERGRERGLRAKAGIHNDVSLNVDVDIEKAVNEIKELEEKIKECEESNRSRDEMLKNKGFNKLGELKSVRME